MPWAKWKERPFGPNQGSSMYVYSRRNRGFENPWVVITLEIRVSFQPQRIFQPQSEHPEGECQAVITPSASLPGSWSTHCVSSSMAQC